MVTISSYRYRNRPFWASSTSRTFFADSVAKRIMPYKNLYQTAITYEIRDTETQYRRIEGGIGDFLSAIGGLNSILVVGIGLLFKLLFGFNPADLFVTSELVASRHSKLASKDEQTKKKRLKKLDRSGSMV